MPNVKSQIQIVDTHETSETLAITRLQRVGYQINRTVLSPDKILSLSGCGENLFAKPLKPTRLVRARRSQKWPRLSIITIKALQVR